MPIPAHRAAVFKAPGAGGDPAPVLRSPAEISPAGCSYSVKIPAHALSRALTILNGTGLPHQGVYVSAEGYGYREVEL